jgi:hypothetical protein
MKTISTSESLIVIGIASDADETIIKCHVGNVSPCMLIAVLERVLAVKKKEIN